MMLPVKIQGGYDLEVQFTRDSREDAVYVGFPVGSGTCGAILS